MTDMSKYLKHKNKMTVLKTQLCHKFDLDCKRTSTIQKPNHIKNVRYNHVKTVLCSIL
jgi:hypothetical protein